jgi:DNA-binding NarL/FixJ family response regulator
MQQKVPIKLLICDDHQIFVEGLAAGLKTVESVDVVGLANNADEVMEVLAQTPIDIVLMDIEMPGTNGIDASKEIFTRYFNTKVIALSMHDSPDVIQSILSSGLHGYIPKNASIDELLSAIQLVQNGQRYFKEAALKKAMEFSEETTALDRLALLTPREKEVIKHIAAGMTAGQIAEELYISEHTVRSYFKTIKRKLEAKHLSNVVAFAHQNGLA